MTTTTKLTKSKKLQTRLPFKLPWDEKSQTARWLRETSATHALSDDAYNLNQYYMQYVFVYGSLKRGFMNHGILKDAMFVSEAVTTRSQYRMFAFGGYQSNFPVVLKRESLGNPRKTEGTIHGEVFLVERKTFSIMDMLEKNGVMYNRNTTRVYNPDINKYFNCWMYTGDEIFWYDKRDDMSLVGHDEESRIYYWMKEHQHAKLRNDKR